MAVYTEVPRPPVGAELNTRCEVTLLNVHKKKGGQARMRRMGRVRYAQRPLLQPPVLGMDAPGIHPFTHGLEHLHTACSP